MIPGMKEAELRAAATCGVCNNLIGASRLPLFWRVRIERWGVKMVAVQRQDGLAAMLGSSVLAAVMGTDEDMAIQVDDPITITVCETCCTKEVAIVNVFESARTKEAA